MIPICPCYTLDIAANESRAQSPYQGLKYCPFDWLHRNQFCFCHGKSDPDGYILQEAQTLCSLYLWPPRWSLCICICTVWQQQSTQYVPEDWFLRILRCPRAVRCPASGAHGHGHTHTRTKLGQAREARCGGVRDTTLRVSAHPKETGMHYNLSAECHIPWPHVCNTVMLWLHPETEIRHFGKIKNLQKSEARCFSNKSN